MAVKVLFEVGHMSKLKSKQTPDGFTHDWELYVRGTDKIDISHYVEKVVFNLHESFPKPKRVLKEAPYILKESGYAGFMVPTEIHFKNRDQPKLMTFTYDLSLQNAGPPVHRSEIKKFTFNSPSDEFRRKLLKGGGVSLVNSAGDDKSRDSLDERSQSSKPPKLSMEDAVKKHKIRPEESKLQTFAKLFGPPITKTTPKVSPDAKSKASPSTATSSGGKGGKSSAEKDKSMATPVLPVKEKPEKVDKKDKHKHTSPHKEKYENKESKKSDEKHDRKEEKKKEKSHSKDRERSHDKSSKRPASPKRGPSPKRPSPVRSSSSASRGGDTNGYKASSKTHSDTTSLNNNGEKIANATSSSSSGKKSKKEKKSYDKERDREKGKDKDRDRKEKSTEDRSSNNSTPVVPAASILNHATVTASTHPSSAAKLSSNDIKLASDYSKIKEKEPVNNSSLKDAAKESIKKSSGDTSSNASEPKKSAEKDEKRHKHKKKDKNKEKEKEHSSAKDSKKKDKSSKKEDVKKTPQPLNDVPPPPPATAQKTNTTPLRTLLPNLSDDDENTRDSVSESVSASVSERHESFAESSNSSVTELAAKAAAASATAPPTVPAPAPPPSVTVPAPISAIADIKPDKKDRKNRDKVKTEKDEKKRKRKSKDDTDASSKSTPPPTLHPEPPAKLVKKEEMIVKNGDRSNSPHLSHINSNSGGGVSLNPSPKGQQHTVDDSKAFRTPNAANVPLPSTSSSSTSNINSNNISQSAASTPPDRPFTVDYISELRDLQQKIMTLQDSNDLQQVVELIAPTGRFEITSKSFDFDLCTLDRNTVQKLQDFFATSCS